MRGHRRSHPHPRLPKVAPVEGRAKVTRGLARLSHRPGSHVVPAQCEPGEGTEAAILYLICPTATLSVRPLTAGGGQAQRSGPKPGFSPAQSAPRPRVPPGPPCSVGIRRTPGSPANSWMAIDIKGLLGHSSVSQEPHGHPPINHPSCVHLPIYTTPSISPSLIHPVPSTSSWARPCYEHPLSTKVDPIGLHPLPAYAPVIGETNNT